MKANLLFCFSWCPSVLDLLEETQLSSVYLLRPWWALGPA